MISGKVVLKKGRDISLQRFHPWVFSGAIANMEGAVTDGCWVSVLNASGNVLGHGHYQNGSIAVRMLSFDKAIPTVEIFREKIQAAYTLRLNSGLISPETNAFR